MGSSPAGAGVRRRQLLGRTIEREGVREVSVAQAVAEREEGRAPVEPVGTARVARTSVRAHAHVREGNVVRVALRIPTHG